MAETKEFKSSPKITVIYWLYSLGYFAPMIAVSAIIGYFNIYAGILFAIGLVVVPLVILAMWIPRFYRSIIFKLEEDHAYAKYGVWWVKEKRVPYNLVSEVRVRQGPLQRSLKLANVDVYTPAQGTLRPELTFFQIDANLASEIASNVRRKVGILSSKERRVIEEEILEELKKIRSILEELREKA